MSYQVRIWPNGVAIAVDEGVEVFEEIVACLGLSDDFEIVEVPDNVNIDEYMAMRESEKC